jgi:DnaD/phage-associated family protein
VSKPWCRLYSEVLDDRKIRRIVTTTGEPKAVIIGVWATFLALANRSEPRGRLEIGKGLPLTFEELAEETGLDQGPLDAIIGEMRLLGMVANDDDTYVLPHFLERNFESDHSTERVRRWRSQQKRQCNGEPPEGRNVTETLLQQDETVTVTPPEQIQNRTEAEAEAEQNGNDTAAAAADPSILQTGVSPDGSPIRIEDYQRTLHAYERNIGPLSEFVCLDIQDALGHSTPETIEDAIQEACRSNVRKWRYIEAILQRWRSEGRSPPPGSKQARASPMSPWAAIGMSADQFAEEFGAEEVERWRQSQAQPP